MNLASKIIAFGHKKKSGKDTCAKFLDGMLRASGVRSHRVAFADKIKDIAYELYSWADLKPRVFYTTEKGIKLKEVILPKIGLTPRQIWIGVGDKLREIHLDTWINHVLKGNGHDVKIITDLRYQQEANAVLAHGGITIKVNRDGLDKGTNPAEVDLDGWDKWDYIIDNNGTLKDLGKTISDLAIQLGLINE